MENQEFLKFEPEFSFEALEPSTREWLLKETKELTALITKVEMGIFEIGERLIADKERLSHGQFIGWVEKELHLHRSTAWLVMNVAKRCVHLEGSNLSPTVLYELASGTTREEVSTFVFEKVKSGEQVTAKELRDLKKKCSRREPAVIGTKLQVHFASDSDEWTTPQKVVALVSKHFGGIDLDPCSNSQDNPNIPAKKHFTKPRKEGELREYEDGLGRDWKGKLFVNPPYGRTLPHWVEQLCHQYEIGHVSEAILLVPARPDTAWFRRLREYPRCFVNGRLKFGNAQDSAPFPSMLVYLGIRLERFANMFSELGDIYQLIPFERRDEVAA